MEFVPNFATNSVMKKFHHGIIIITPAIDFHSLYSVRKQNKVFYSLSLPFSQNPVTRSPDLRRYSRWIAVSTRFGCRAVGAVRLGSVVGAVPPVRSGCHPYIVGPRCGGAAPYVAVPRGRVGGRATRGDQVLLGCRAACVAP